MPAVGSSVVDVLRELQYRFAKLEPVVAAYLQYDPRGNRIAITTLLEDFDPDVEARIANVEVFVNQTYEDFAFTFDTVHLKGRDPAMFERPGASLLVDRTGRSRQVIG